ncbi:MAG: malate dehydrogenase (quinone) [Cyclobacteriaceae bacterium]|jgi:malate dehydrogenase (quinone)|nr:malate dehydrogenase (quinone) [Flammeovirgaceae bacterium]MCZ8021627.1 malate dehydrogenase (quinone) [Cytophagales bacterium]MCZ8327283.1 malate dehydrogenase (quinone) [Cyclobacteriaceae bacterium]
MTKTIKPLVPYSDVVLMGAGIMSATLGLLLKELSPDISIQIFERMDEAGTESSDAWHNAGTGHAAFCELNYTPQRLNGNVDISKAIKISEQFELSREFWAYLVEKNYIGNPKEFITKVPHISFVWGDDNVNFLKTRYQLMNESALFKGMQFTQDERVLTDWAPLVMQGRKGNLPLAGTKMDIGTDINFGTLTRAMIKKLTSMPGVTMHYHTEALDLDPDGKGGWVVKVKSLLTDEKYKSKTKFVFIGAGGATLHLLKRAEIEERDGYGGFPVGGLWLKCHNKKLIELHNAKVYGKASVGSPPMSVPHIDTRYIDGKKELLFGPFASFSTKFLKNGSLMDLPKSIKFDNAIPMIFAGLKNIPLTKYLIEQLRLKPEDRLESLRDYVPLAELGDWELKEAGQRVQVIKKDKKEKGILEFGTEVVVSEDGTVAALLGASPGASTSAAVMLDIVKKCFKREIHTKAWQEKLHEIFPTYGHALAKEEKLLQATRERTAKVLNL